MIERVIATIVAVIAVGVLTPAPVEVPASTAALPALSHVFVIVMENQAYGNIIGSPSAPYINSLAASGALATNYSAVIHPSLPNYLALTGADTFGITSDCTTCWVSAPNIADRLDAAGKTWKTYQESMPSACFVGDRSPYMQKHNPLIYLNDVRTNSARCQGHVVPYTQLATDLTSAASTPTSWSGCGSSPLAAKGRGRSRRSWRERRLVRTRFSSSSWRP